METGERITELTKATGVFLQVAADQCWVDSKVHCPFGTPEGSFIHRPEMFCHSGCQHFRDHVDSTSQYKAKWNGLEFLLEHFEGQHVTITSELRTRADECEKGSAEAQVLLDAADVIESKKFDRDILLRDDLPA